MPQTWIFDSALPEKKIILSLDSQKTYRIFDNLYTNIIKYALKGTRVYVTLTEEKERSSEGNLSPASSGKNREYVRIELKNISASELFVDPNELTERFVRGDGSRNTEGSGLGLAIAKSFAELQGGSMRIEVDGDLFKAILTFPQKDEAMDGGNAQEQVPKGDQIHPASPHPPIPWNKNSNRFYRKNDMRTPASADRAKNIFSSRNMFSIDGRNLLTQDRTQTRFGMLKRFRMPTEFRMQIHFRKKRKIGEKRQIFRNPKLVEDSVVRKAKIKGE